MYKIDEKSNRIEKVERKTFSELNYSERENFQEWICNNPEVFNEELLIIQKEFNGFNETNERLDLLALDKQGNIVVIENKLDDSGKDVVWQVLKYAAYCSTLSKNNIIDIYQEYLDKNSIQEQAAEKLSEFYDIEDVEELKLNIGNTQRLILVAAKFRKEITSAVLWLMNYKLRIQCFKVTPYKRGSDTYINFDQIIPVKDIEEYVISMAEKSQDDIATQEDKKSSDKIRTKFWKEYLDKINTRIDLYKNVNPAKNHWISGGVGIFGVGLNSGISKKYGRVELYISTGNKEDNKKIFDELLKKKEEIEKEFDKEIIWERLDNRKASRIKCELSGVSYLNKEDWNKMIEFMVDAMESLYKALKTPLAEVKKMI